MVLGIVQRNDLPQVRVFMNCSYAIKIFEGVNKPKKYREVWQYILSDLFSSIRSGKHYRSFELVHGTTDAALEGALRQTLLTGLMDKTTPIIDSTDSCQELIDKMDPISPLVLRALADDTSLDIGLLSPEVKAGVKWLGKDRTPQQVRTVSTSRITCKDTPSTATTSPQRPSVPLPDIATTSAPQAGGPILTDRSAASSPVLGLIAPSATLDVGIPPDGSSQRSFWEASASGASSQSIHMHLDSTMPSIFDSQDQVPSTTASVPAPPGPLDDQCTIEDLRSNRTHSY